MFKIECETALPGKSRARYKGLAFDGRCFYLTVCREHKIIQLDSHFHQQKCFDTDRCYTCLCFDPAERCFWAAAEGGAGTLFRLNECCEEVGCIPLCGCGGCGEVTGISHNCCKGMLAVSFLSGVARVDPKNPKECSFFIKNPCEWVMGVLSLCPYTLCRCIDGEKQVIRCYSECGKPIGETKIPCGMTVEAAVFMPCEHDHCGRRFAVLATKPGGYPCMLDCVMACGKPCEDICACNHRICCEDCHCEKPHRCRDCKESCCDVLESVALVEASIAHILNAEGEKLQKVIASTDDICKILEVNCSVRKTIEKATHLEVVLLEKIDALKECCDFCGRDDCDKHCDKCCDNCCDCESDCIRCKERVHRPS